MDRSTLFNIEPIGVGTPFVESLTSYIVRLSEAHCVWTGSMISKIYAPLLQKEYLSKTSLRGGDGFFDSAIGINGIGKLANEFTDLTEKLTGRTDLSFTTLKSFSEILPNRGLLKKTRSWCPLCYEEWKREGLVIYDPLIWHFQCVNTCLLHNIPLVNVCEHCKQLVPIINRKSIPGTCSKCGQWLGVKQVDAIRDKDATLHDISLIGELIAKSILEISGACPTDSVNYYVSSLFDGSPTKAASHLNIPRSTLFLWMSGKSIPSVNYLLHISNMLGISIIGFLNKDENVSLIHSDEDFIKMRVRHDHCEIRSILNNVIGAKEPVSISELARRIGCDRKLLSTMYKDECEQIKTTYNQHILTKRKENEQQKLSKLEGAFTSLVSQGIYPSRRQMEKVLGTGFLKEKATQKHWNDLKRSGQDALQKTR